MKELLKALVAAKISFAPIKKDKVNPFHKSKYSSLDSVLDAVEPSLHLNGLVLSHSITEGRLITRLYHTSGDYLESSFELPDLSDPQKLGSIISYYRRYAVCSLLSVTADEDDDAEAAKPSQAAAKVPDRARISLPAIAAPKAIVPAADPQIALKKQALTECMEILEWSSIEKANWAKTISPLPFAQWDANTWDLAVVKALSAIDQMSDNLVLA